MNGSFGVDGYIDDLRVLIHCTPATGLALQKPAKAIKDFSERIPSRAISERTESTGFSRALGPRGHSSFAGMMQLDRSLL